MERTRAERRVDYVGCSRKKYWSTFLKETRRNRIRIRLFIETVKSIFEISDSVAGLVIGEN